MKKLPDIKPPPAPHAGYEKQPPRTSKCGRYVEIDAGTVADLKHHYDLLGIPPAPTIIQPTNRRKGNY